MGQEIVYCSECGARVVTADFAKGSAVRHENRILCSGCAPVRAAGKDTAAKPERHLPPSSRRGPPSSTRLAAPAARSMPAKAGWAVFGALAGGLVLAGFLAFSGGGAPAPAPEPAPRALRPPPSAPPGEAEKPASGPSAPPAREDDAALERQMAAAMERQKQERFARFLEEIRGRIDADPGLSQQPEIEAMLDVAEKEAGALLPEIAKLRGDYAQRRERATRDASLVGHWPLDEGSGASAKDVSGRGHDGRIVSKSPRWVAGRSGSALEFDGPQDYVVLPATDALSSVQEGSYTLSAWFKPADVPAQEGRYGILIRPGHHLGLSYSSEQRFHMDHWLADSNRGVETGAFPPGRFYHLAGVVDRGEGATRLYVDGSLAKSRSWSAGSAARAFTKGSWFVGIASTSNPRFRWSARGVVDDVRIYDRALSAKEISELAHPTAR